MAVIAGKEDRKENARLKKGESKFMGVFITGVVDFEEETVTSLGLPIPMAALKRVFNMKTLDERVDKMATILDSNNLRRTEGPKLAIKANRPMSVHLLASRGIKDREHDSSHEQSRRI